MSLDKYTNQTINKQDNKKRINKNKNNMTVKRKSPETSNPIKKQKRISTDEKIEIAISKLEEYEKAVKDTLKMLREIKRESLRPPPIKIPELTATFSSSDESVTPKYSGASPQYENFITAPQQLIDAPDGSQISKRVFPDGSEVVVLASESQAHSPCLPNFVGSPRICIDDCCCFDEPIDLISDIEEEDFEDSEYSGLEGKQKAFYDWRVVPFQALARGWLVRKNKKPPVEEDTTYSHMDGKMRAYYGCQAIKMQAVVRGGLVRMRLWREKCKKTTEILMKGLVPLQALVRGWLARKNKKCVKHDFIPVRSGFDHTTYECRNCDYESGCV